MRVPGEDRMVAFTRNDCRILDAGVHWNGVKVNGMPGVATFTCY